MLSLTAVASTAVANLGSLMTGLMLGLLLGMRHALEPDHLAAVSTLVGARGQRAGAVLGAAWGIGHTTALVVVGCVLGAMQASLPASLASTFEVMVALVLVTFGARAIARAWSLRSLVGRIVTHDHGGGRWTLARQPLLLGVVHGLAGSGALTALVLARMPTPATRLAYIVLFGMGSILGMAFLTGVAGWPLARLGHSTRFVRALAAVTGTFSVCLGGWWGWSAVEGLLRG